MSLWDETSGLVLSVLTRRLAAIVRDRATELNTLPTADSPDQTSSIDYEAATVNAFLLEISHEKNDDQNADRAGARHRRGT